MTEKAITSEALDDGGRLQPAQGLPKPTTAKPVPKDGVVVSPPALAEAVLSGKKSLIVKSKPYEIAGRELLLLSQGKALGIVKLGAIEKLDAKQFAELEPRHLISDETLKGWCEAQPSWCEGPWWGWAVKVVEKFDAPKDTSAGPGPHIVAKDVAVQGLTEKIQDPGTYDPGDITDDRLRDDFRILLAWYATWKKDPEGFAHSIETIETLLRKVIKELVRRGPDTIRFNPKGMMPSVRPFFLQVARDVKVPEEMYKRANLKVDSDPKQMTAAELDQAHWELHEMFSKESLSQNGVEGWSIEDIVNLHARVVDEMYKRGGGGHPPPPDNGLDEVSGDFEKYADKQPKWHEMPGRKVEKAEYARIQRSGQKRGPKISLTDVLPHLQTFKVRKPYIYLVGGLANHGETEGDIDILIKEGEELPEDLKHIIHFRLGRALPPEIAERIEIHYDNFHGPFTKFIELYDLTFERVNVKNEIKEMRLKREDDTEGEEYLDEREFVYAEECQKNWEDDDADDNS